MMFIFYEDNRLDFRCNTSFDRIRNKISTSLERERQLLLDYCFHLQLILCHMSMHHISHVKHFVSVSIKETNATLLSNTRIRVSLRSGISFLFDAKTWRTDMRRRPYSTCNNAFRILEWTQTLTLMILQKQE